MNNQFAETQEIYKQIIKRAYAHLEFSNKQKIVSELKNDVSKREIGAFTFDDFIKSDDGSMVKCPMDPQHRVGKNGKDRTGKQRYVCKDCGKHFSATSGSLSSNSMQDLSKWIPFVLCMLQYKTVEETSKECGISKSTVLAWHVKVFDAIESLMDKVKLSDIIIADETYVDYNLKGNHGDDFLMPRNPHSRGSQNTRKNYQKNSMCILCAIDCHGKSFSKIIGFGTPSAKRIISGFENKLDIDDNTVLVSDGASVYGVAVNHYGISNWQKLVTQTKGKKRVPDTTGEYNIQSINAYHSKLKSFLHNYKGISSKYLQGYLTLFDFKQNNKGVDENFLCQQILSAMASLDYVSEAEALTKKYTYPVSNGKETEMWERKVPIKEQKIYRDWYNKMPIKDIEKKYKIDKRKIYTIKDKVIKYDLHDKIICSLQIRKRSRNVISQRNWEIFLLYYHNRISMPKIGMHFGISRQRVKQIIDSLNKRPESENIVKNVRIKSPTILKRDIDAKINVQLFRDFIFLNSPEISLRTIYELLSKKYNLSQGAITGRLDKMRKQNNMLKQNRSWKAERKELKSAEYEKFLQNRNTCVYDDFVAITTKNCIPKKKDIYSIICEKYNLSFSHVMRIVRLMRQEQSQAPAQSLQSP